MSAHVPSPFSNRNLFAITVSAMLFLSTMIISGPAAALSGEGEITAGAMFLLTYEDAVGNDVVWWDWHIVGKGGPLTFAITVIDYEGNPNVDSNGGGIVHVEVATHSKGRFQLPPHVHGVVVSWTPQYFEDIVLHYDVKLNPPDLTPYYIAVGALMAVPAAFIVVVFYREKKRAPPAG